jgi:hypothetical protein
MNITAKAPVVALEAGEVLTLEDAQGTTILARLGTVWITEEGDERDHIVGPGDSLVVARRGRTVVQALKAAWVSLTEGITPANDTPYELQSRSPDEACDDARARVARYY